MMDVEAGFQRYNALSRNNIALVDFGSISIISKKFDTVKNSNKKLMFIGPCITLLVE